MKKTIALTLFCFACSFLPAQEFSVTGLSCEHRTDPVGLDTREPRFSWKTQTIARGWRQNAYRIQAATGSDFSDKTVVWDSGKTTSDASVLQSYRGAQLTSGTRYFWRVKVWDERGQESAWSPTAFWETALLSPSDWKAAWIEPEQEAAPPRYSPAHLLRKEFAIIKKIASARAYATAHGLYELYLNG